MTVDLGGRPHKLSAAFAAVFCLIAASHARAQVNQSGNLLWSADLPGLPTDASVTPVVFSPIWGIYDSLFSFQFSNAVFHGDSIGQGGHVFTGGDIFGGPIVPGSGLPATTNYIESAGGGPITMTIMDAVPESYLGFLTQSTSSFNVTLYDANGTSLGEISAGQLDSAAAAEGYAWINIDVASGDTYTSAVFSPTNGTVFDISYGTTPEPLTSTDGVPLPALAGTIPGFAVALVGMGGLRRRSRHS